MDPRRLISMLVVVVGVTGMAVGLAGSSLPLTPGGSVFAGAGPILGAFFGTYIGRRATAGRRVALGAAAYGAAKAGVIIVAIFGTAAVIRPSVRGVPELGDASAGVVIAGMLVMLAGAMLWEREKHERRFVASLLLALWLIVGAMIASTSGAPWTWLGALAVLVGFGLLLRAFATHSSPGTGWAKPTD